MDYISRMPLKTCSVCHIPKDLDNDFYKSKQSKDGKSSRCKECDGKKRKRHHDNNLEQEAKRAAKYYEEHKDTIAPRMAEYGAQWYLENKEKKDADNKAWHEAHPDAAREYAREWRKNNPEKVKESIRKYRKANKEKIATQRRARIQKIRDYKKLRNATDVAFRLYNLLSTRMRNAILRSSGIKYNATMELIGCSPAFLKDYLESLFKRGMSWENYGTFWEIDHIIPCDKWDLTDPREQLRCFHFSNLQPLSRKRNRRKSNTITDPQTKLLL
jgi:hypothetical protein